MYEDDDSKIDRSQPPDNIDRSILSTINLQPAYALREAWREGFNAQKVRADIMAGMIVAIVALPLSMALSIASGAPPQYGIYTAIIAGAIISLLGGSRTQVSGPTAAFVVILAPIATKFGIGGLLLACVLAGIILVIGSLLKVGKFIEFIPSPVTTGFTTGIAIVIAVLQLKDLLGLKVEHMPEAFPERVYAIIRALPTIQWSDLLIGLFTLSLLIVWPKINKRIPSPLIALATATLTAFLINKFYPGFSVATIGHKFTYMIDGVQHAGIPRTPPLPLLPWHLPNAYGQPIGLSLSLLRELLPSAFAIAVLGAIESLLSAVISDAMIETKHEPNAELFALGIGNIIAPFFGGIAATGAIARTVTNIRFGGRSPIASLSHALFVLFAVLLFAPIMAYLPMASLAALLILVAWNMSEAKHFIHILRIAPTSDIAVLIVCCLLTVVFDMVIGVSAGLILASMLFMHEMATSSKVKVVAPHHHLLRQPLPPETTLYEISGPLFFGAAQRAISTLNSIGQKTQTIILYMDAVQMIDATGLINLKSALNSLKKDNVFVILVGLRKKPARVLAKAGVSSEEGHLAICKNFPIALELAQKISKKRIETGTSKIDLKPQPLLKSFNQIKS